MRRRSKYFIGIFRIKENQLGENTGVEEKTDNVIATE